MKAIRQTTFDDCALIYQLAVSSWKAAYSDLLSESQISYMLEMMYSEKSLKRQMREGHIFFIALFDDVPVGYISFHPKGEGLYILEKLYMLPQMQGKGMGRFLVEKAEEYILKQRSGQHFLFELNVNRENKAVGFYQQVGFHIAREVDEDIGNGFYKNDYIMQKVVGFHHS